MGNDRPCLVSPAGSQNRGREFDAMIPDKPMMRKSTMPIAVVGRLVWPPTGVSKRSSGRQRKIGRGEPERSTCALGRYNTYRYIGLTRHPGYRFAAHKKLKNKENRFFYLGEIATQGIVGRRRGRRRAPDLSYAEWALIRFSNQNSTRI